MNKDMFNVVRIIYENPLYVWIIIILLILFWIVYNTVEYNNHKE